MRKSAQAAATKYHSQSKNNRIYKAFCTRRGIDQEMCERFQLGVVARPLVGHEKYKDMMVIPYFTTGGVVKIRFRCMQDHKCEHPKYLDLPGSRPWLYNAPAVLESAAFICITEGELDVVAVEGLEIPAVGFPGASTWTSNPYWARCFAGWSDIVVIADGDETGKKAARVVAESMPQARIVEMPDGHDSSSLINEDPEKWMEMVEMHD